MPRTVSMGRCEFVYSDGQRCPEDATISCQYGRCSPYTLYCTIHFVACHDMNMAEEPEIKQFQQAQLLAKEAREQAAAAARKEAQC